MKVLITGSPGSGKTTIADALSTAGFNSYDGEAVDGLIRLEIATTGEPADWPEGHVDWDYYAWNIQADVLTKLLASKEAIFVAMSTSNLSEFKPYFDKVIVLSVNNEALGRRLRARTTHEFGQTETNIQRWVDRNRSVTEKHAQEGGVVLDSSKPISEVIQDILSVCGIAA